MVEDATRVLYRPLFGEGHSLKSRMSSTGAPGGMEPASPGGTVATSVGAGGPGLVGVDPMHAEAKTTRSITANIRDIPSTVVSTSSLTNRNDSSPTMAFEQLGAAVRARGTVVQGLGRQPGRHLRARVGIQCL